MKMVQQAKANTGWLQKLVPNFINQKILVIGDLILDRYIYGAVSRISPEAPVPVVQVTNEKNMPGGAANVARNVRSLGGNVVLSGIVGQDQSGRDLLSILSDEGIATDGVMSLPQLRTTVKTRILAEHQQVVRVDRDDPVSLPADMLSEFCRIAADAVSHVSGVIIEDYAKGTVQQEVVDVVLAAAKKQGVLIAFDPKENSNLKIDGISVATPNRKETFVLACLPEMSTPDDPLKDKALLRAADILLEQWTPDFLIVTLGSHGMLLISKNQKPCRVHTVAQEVFDVSGAGDTVVAAALLALCAGADHNQAAELANCAAGVVVGKVGTATCTVKELEKCGSDLNGKL